MKIKPASDWGLDPWPVDQPFPFDAEACVALCRGDIVHTDLGAEEARRCLPFRFEMVDGWIAIRRD